jgi:hypothetical protein
MGEELLAARMKPYSINRKRPFVRTKEINLASKIYLQTPKSLLLPTKKNQQLITRNNQGHLWNLEKLSRKAEERG